MSALAAVDVLTVPAPQSIAGTTNDWPPQCEDSTASPHSDHANAHRLVRHKGSNLAYTIGLGWLSWRKPCGPWKPDELAARKAAAGLGRIVADEAAEMAKRAAAIEDDAARKELMRRVEERLKWARTSESRAAVANALAMAEPLLAVDANTIDANQMLLSCPNGVVELRTGRLRPHHRLDWSTMVTGAPFDPRTTAPTWARFVREVLSEDDSLIAWVQAFAGYCLTGLTTEHLLVIAHGGGSNGKTTFLDALEHALGDYAKPAAPGLLMQRRNEQHSTELMDLRGARLVISNESGEGHRLAEDSVKQMTGGDKLKARLLFKDFVSFTPTHKLVLATNHRPVIVGGDHAIWRRIRLVPFLRRFEGKDKDPHLPEKLKSEAPGILRWCLEGLQKYLRNGFPACPAIDGASAQYRDDSDLLGQFLTDECTTGPGLSVTAGELYQAFKAWSMDNGVNPWSKRTLGMRLSERGFTDGKGTGGVRRWSGLHVNETDRERRRWAA